MKGKGVLALLAILFAAGLMAGAVALTVTAASGQPANAGRGIQFGLYLAAVGAFCIFLAALVDRLKARKAKQQIAKEILHESKVLEISTQKPQELWAFLTSDSLHILPKNKRRNDLAFHALLEEIQNVKVLSKNNLNLKDIRLSMQDGRKYTFTLELTANQKFLLALLRTGKDFSHYEAARQAALFPQGIAGGVIPMSVIIDRNFGGIYSTVLCGCGIPAGIFFSDGEIIGSAGNTSIQEAAEKLLDQMEPFLPMMKQTNSTSFPPLYTHRIYCNTGSHLYSYDIKASDLHKLGEPAQKVYLAYQALIVAFREANAPGGTMQ